MAKKLQHRLNKRDQKKLFDTLKIKEPKFVTSKAIETWLDDVKSAILKFRDREIGGSFDWENDFFGISLEKNKVGKPATYRITTGGNIYLGNTHDTYGDERHWIERENPDWQPTIAEAYQAFIYDLEGILDEFPSVFEDARIERRTIRNRRLGRKDDYDEDERPFAKRKSVI